MEKEIAEAKIMFTVPQSWLEEKNYPAKNVALYVFEKDTWRKLKTKIVSEQEDNVFYQAEVSHFSYFAISASPEKATIFDRALQGIINFIPGHLGKREYVLIGIFLLIFTLGVIYFFLREKEE